MKRQHKRYSRPKTPFNKERIDQEVKIKKRFGLKNKREIWRAQAEIDSIREKAKTLIGASEEEQKELFGRLNKMGLNVNSIGDVLGLEKEDYLERRLQTLVYRKQLAKTAREARQLITHRKVKINNRIVDTPSYLVPVQEEDTIEVIKPEKNVKSQQETQE